MMVATTPYELVLDAGERAFNHPFPALRRLILHCCLVTSHANFRRGSQFSGFWSGVYEEEKAGRVHLIIYPS